MFLLPRRLAMCPLRFRFRPVSQDTVTSYSTTGTWQKVLKPLLLGVGGPQTGLVASHRDLQPLAPCRCSREPSSSKRAVVSIQFCSF